MIPKYDLHQEHHLILCHYLTRKANASMISAKDLPQDTNMIPRHSFPHEYNLPRHGPPYKAYLHQKDQS
jgi:hypothetical protein